MKKGTVFFALTAVVSLLAGCGGATAGKAPIEVFNAPFMMTADYEMDTLKGSLIFESDGGSAYRLVYQSPETVAGMTVELKGREATVDFEGIHYETALADLSPYHPICLLTEMVTGIRQEECTVTQQENGDLVLEFENGAQATFYDGVPKTISVPSALFSLHVTGFERPLPDMDGGNAS